jgi:hypothetical protein
MRAVRRDPREGKFTYVALLAQAGVFPRSGVRASNMISNDMSLKRGFFHMQKKGGVYGFNETEKKNKQK